MSSRDRHIQRQVHLGQKFFGFTLLLVVSIPAAVHAQQRRRIAVMSFEVGADAKQKAAQQFGIRDDLGRDLSDLLVQKLVTDGKFIVIEREALDKIMKEQNFSNSDRADASSAAKIGKLLGADAIVIGSVTQFGAEQKDTKMGGLMHNIPHMGGAGVDKKTSMVEVATTARMVDTSTGEILAAATGAGTSSKSQTSFLSTSSNNAAAYDTSSKDFGSTLIGEATLKAIDSMAMQLELAPASMTAPVAAPRASYSGVVADVSGNTIIVTVGSKSGVKVGDTIEISRPVRTVKNPQTGAVLKVVTQSIGEAKVTETDPGSATATYSGEAVVKLNDTISSTQ